MVYRVFFRCVIALGVVVGLGSGLSSFAAPPNVVVFIADDVAWKDFGCYGNDAIRTPHIDALAAGGLKFENAFLTVAQCSPSRISILSGRYPHATGAEDLHMPLLPGDGIVPGYLKEAGYFSGHMRKTHYGKHANAQFDWYDKGLTNFDGFLDAAGEKPFFMWVGFVDAHRPYEAGAVSPPHDPATVKVPPYLVDTPETREDLALYYDEVSRMDGVIGRFVETLEKRNLRDNTLIIFLADNGMPFPRAKGTVYDSGVGTPLVMNWPAGIPQARSYSGLTSVIDLAPTILDLADVSTKGRGFQGKSLLQVVMGRSPKGREYVFSERNWHDCDDHIRSVRTKRYKLIKNAYLDIPHGTPADLGKSPSFKDLLAAKGAGTLTPEQAHLFTVPRPEYELYDLKKDPGEFTNIIDTPRGKRIAAKLSGVLADWSNDTGDFSPVYRRRGDHTDRYTGERTQKKVPPQTHPLP